MAQSPENEMATTDSRNNPFVVPTDNIKILTVGTGAVGAIYSWRLSASTYVATVCRSNYDIVQRDGFDISSVKWGNHVYRPVKVVRSITEAVADGDEFDYLIVALKALPDVYDVAEIIRPAVTIGKTCIVLMQNGLGIETPVAKTFPTNSLLSVVAYIGVSQLSSGQIEMHGMELLKIGIFPKVVVDKAKQVEARDRFVGVLRRGGVDVEVVEDIQADRWQKLIWNGSFSPISILTLSDTKLIVNDPDQKALIINLMRDVIRAAAAYGYIFDEEATIAEMFAKTARIAPGYKSSMLIDLEKGQPMEVEVILGNAYREAKAKGVAVPYMETIYTLCNAVNQREKKAREMKAAQNTPV